MDVLRERARRLSKKHQAYQAEVERLRVQLKAHEVELGGPWWRPEPRSLDVYGDAAGD